jgi:lysozyme family protein
MKRSKPERLEIYNRQYWLTVSRPSSDLEIYNRQYWIRIHGAA